MPPATPSCFLNCDSDNKDAVWLACADTSVAYFCGIRVPATAPVVFIDFESHYEAAGKLVCSDMCLIFLEIQGEGRLVCSDLCVACIHVQS